ncbi:MAG: response regulator transcription factor [Anaerolineae bacterium]|nr:response regulator transcription factor [Anaerolineae bacterium]
MAELAPIRVLIVDDHAVVRSGLSAFLMIFDDLDLVGDASSGAEALIQAAMHKPLIGHDLTQRELEIIKLLAEGLSNPEIAQRLYVSRSTVKFHVSNVLSKLGAESRTEAVAIALQNHLV